MRPDVGQEWRGLLRQFLLAGAQRNRDGAQSGAPPELPKLATKIHEDAREENTGRRQQNRECDGFHFYLPAMGTETFGSHASEENAPGRF
jgi:hypothetical protein